MRDKKINMEDETANTQNSETSSLICIDRVLMNATRAAFECRTSV